MSRDDFNVLVSVAIVYFLIYASLVLAVAHWRNAMLLADHRSSNWTDACKRFGLKR